MQPAAVIAEQQSQHAWIIAQQSLSPLVQVMQQPSSVISHLQRPIDRLQQQTIMPLNMTQHEHMPPASIVQRFCIIAHDILSSQVQVIFMPPGHFSILMVQRGTIIIDEPDGIEPVEPIIPGPAVAAPIPIPMFIPARSSIIALAIYPYPRQGSSHPPRDHVVIVTVAIIPADVTNARTNLKLYYHI